MTYKKVKLIKKSQFVESWLAKNSEKECFLKVIKRNSKEIDVGLTHFLNKSYSLQRTIRNRDIHVAIGKTQTNDELLFEYPVLPAKEWTSVTREMFLSNAKPILCKIGSIVDLLHLLGFAHLDLKIQNFLINSNDLLPKLKLIDLDFLCKANERVNAKIIGTPGQIAPEILSNGKVGVKSDIFSLGLSIRQLLSSMETIPKDCILSASELKSLMSWCSSMGSEEANNRPFSVLNSLVEFNLMSNQEHQYYLKKLLKNLIESKVRTITASKWKSQKGLRGFLTNEVRIFGIPDELVADLEDLLTSNRTSVYRIIGKLIANSKITLIGEFWIIEIDDYKLLQIYNSQLSEYFGLESGTKINPNEQPVKLILFNMNSGIKSKENHVLSTNGILSQARALVKLNRVNEAVEYFAMYLASVNSESSSNTDIVREYVSCLATIGQYDEAIDVCNQWISNTIRLERYSDTILLRAQNAWLESARGNHNQGLNIIDEIMEQVNDESIPSIKVKVLEAQGSIEWRRGNLHYAKDIYQSAAKLAQSLEDSALQRNSFIALMSLYALLGDYSKSLKWAKSSESTLSGKKDNYKLQLVYKTLINCLSRMGQNNKADYWLNKFLALNTSNTSTLQYAEYHLTKGWIELNRGRLDEAEDSFSRSYNVLLTIDDQRELSKLYFNLAELSLYRGNVEKVQDYLAKASTIYKSLDDRDSTKEIDVLRQVASIDITKEVVLDELLELSLELVECHRIYFAMTALIHYLLYTSSLDSQKIEGKLSKLVLGFASSKVPLYKSVFHIMEFRKLDRSNDSDAIVHLKRAFKVLDSSEHLYLAMHLCVRIAKYYVANQNVKLAEKFFKHGAKIAKELSNSSASNAISTFTEELKKLHSDRDRLVDCYLGISDILNKDDYEYSSLDKILEFALNQTGAERGVLLIRNHDSNLTQVKASINIDDRSLKEVTDFSKTVPEIIDKDFAPLIINDALVDERTKTIESICIHNIRSVICLPIRIDGNKSAYLYLDHHSIPALFEIDDINYLNSIANFIGTLLKTINKVKTASIVKNERALQGNRPDASNVYIASSVTMNKLLSELPMIARSNATILLEGESGTGKEILTNMIHNSSLRSDGPLVKLNCSSIASTLIESELFGIEKRVASEVDARPGKFEAADGGTLFLDEIGDMPLEIQAKVLRAIEYQEFQRVGSNKSTYTDARFICATNKNLKELVKNGDFRSDLYYRISVCTIDVPALRNRPEDVRPLIEHFTKQFCQDSRNRPEFSSSSLNALEKYSWPGNVRELRNLVEKYCITHIGRRITGDSLPSHILEDNKNAKSRSNGNELLEKKRIKESLSKNKGNQSKVARELQMPLTTLRRKIKKYQIPISF